MDAQTTPQISKFVRTISECAAELGIAHKTLRNLIDRGDGPTVTRLSPGRVGIRNDHFLAWLDSRQQKGGKAA